MDGRYQLLATRIDNVVDLIQNGSVVDAINHLIGIASELVDIHLLIPPNVTEFVKVVLVYLITCNKPVGRPKIHGIEKQQLSYLLSIGLRPPLIAEYYNVSRFTIHQRMSEFGLSIRQMRSTLSQADLENEVSNILLQFPNTGTKRMMGYLRARSIHIQRYKVSLAIRSVDPDGVQARRLIRNRTIRRRQYYVKYSNQMWHIDGNLKLRRWGIVVRCGIDGKSRCVTYINASNTNDAASHLESFVQGTIRHGIPSRTRSDKGGENVKIAQFMLETRGLGRGSHICGRSVHNQRIERYWREVFEGCNAAIYDMFTKLEEDGVLDVFNACHIWLLHYIFLPRLNNLLQSFIEGWNNHSLSTEHNRTPNQLMFLHLPPESEDMFLPENELAGVDFMCDEINDLGRFDSINNPEIDLSFVPDDLVLHQIRTIDVNKHSENLGYDVFIEALSILCNEPIN